MDTEDLSYEEALKEAQKLGFAEANPESDVMDMIQLENLQYYQV